MKGLRLLFVVLLLALGLGLSLYIAHEERTPIEGTPPVLSTIETGHKANSLVEPPSQDQREITDHNQRRILRGQVRSLTGSPVPGAHVIQIEQQSEDLESPHSWTFLGWNQPNRRSSSTETDSAGYFEIKKAGESALGCVLIAFHPEYFAGGVDMPEGAWKTNPEILLEPATAINVQVLDPSGKPQAGATVHHAALPRRPRPEEMPIQAYERWLKTPSADGMGKCSFPFRGEVLGAEGRTGLGSLARPPAFNRDPDAGPIIHAGRNGDGS
jgi:hypothetical protein